MNEQELRAGMGEGRTQCERVLHCLREHSPSWVAMPVLALAATRTGIGVAVHSRVSELRARGHVIEHQQDHKDGAVHSFYRLVLPGDGAVKETP